MGVLTTEPRRGDVLITVDGYLSETLTEVGNVNVVCGTAHVRSFSEKWGRLRCVTYGVEGYEKMSI